MIDASALSDWVKERSIGVFERVAIAEGKVHGLPPEKVHFHEVGAVDSIVDIVGACICLEILGKPRVQSGNVVEGHGFVLCAHGRFPIPTAATLEILGQRGIPISQCEEPSELVTPTGAAILAEFAESFGPMSGMAASRIGYGLGTRDNKTRPNVLRACLGETSASATIDWETDFVTVIEVNLDDSLPEHVGHLADGLMGAGALDVFQTPVLMKKQRQGILLTVLCEDGLSDVLSEKILRESSAFGLRRHRCERRKLKRRSVEIETTFGKVRVKQAMLEGKVVKSAPEHDDCAALASEKGVGITDVYQAALNAVSR